MTSGENRFRSRYGPWALVAGGSDGIGCESVRQLAARRLSVVLTGRREKLLAEVAEGITAEYDVAARPLSIDLSDPSRVEELLDAISDLEIGLVVCNAALSAIAPFLDHPIERHRRLVVAPWSCPVLCSGLPPSSCTRPAAAGPPHKLLLRLRHYRLEPLLGARARVPCGLFAPRPLPPACN